MSGRACQPERGILAAPRLGERWEHVLVALHDGATLADAGNSGSGRIVTDCNSAARSRNPLPKPAPDDTALLPGPPNLSAKNVPKIGEQAAQQHQDFGG